MEHIFCNQCGHKNVIESKFCSGCGTAFAQEREIVVEDSAVERPITPTVSNDAKCPVCNEADQTQKVSAIVAAQTSSSRVSGYNFGTESSYYGRSSSRSALAEQLKKPSPPFHATVAADLVNKGSKGLMFVMGLLGLGFAVLLFALDAPILCTGFFGLAPVMFFWLAFSKDESPTKQQTEELLNFEIAEERWEKSYYCYRCDHVFLSHNGTKWYNNSSNFHKLMYGKLE